MTELRCPICGGNLILTAEDVFVCESCGNRMMKPAAAASTCTEELMASAGRLMAVGDYDSAYIAYENVLLKEPANCEARWNLILCRFGVRYEEDPLTGANKPTINRIRYDSIREDPDYKELLSYVPAADRGVYTARAEEIAFIQERSLEIARSQPPYDVFISFKAENNGVRTRDSVIAQEIYDRLTERGIRTFYSRITLQGKAGTEYEPYIFSALNSAKLLLLVGCSRTNVESRWVRNEWSRFLALMAGDHDKYILPVYEGMDREDFPAEIPVREAVDYSQDGALSEIVQGVLKLAGMGVVYDAEDAAGTAARLNTALRAQVENGQWQKARETANEILDLNPENGDAYFYLLLVEYRVTKPTMLADIDAPWFESRNYLRAKRYAVPARVQMLDALKVRRDMRLSAKQEQLLAEAEKTRLVNEATPAFNHALWEMQNGYFSAAVKTLAGPAYNHPQAAEMAALCKRADIAKNELKNSRFFFKQMNEYYPEVIAEGHALYKRASKARLKGLFSKKVREQEILPYENFVREKLEPLEDQFWAEYVKSLEGSGLKLERPHSSVIEIELSIQDDDTILYYR